MAILLLASPGLAGETGLSAADPSTIAQTNAPADITATPITSDEEASDRPAQPSQAVRQSPVMVSEPIVQAAPNTEVGQPETAAPQAKPNGPIQEEPEAEPVSEPENATPERVFVSQPVVQAIPEATKSAMLPEAASGSPAQAMPAPEARPTTPARAFVSNPVVQALPEAKSEEPDTTARPEAEPDRSLQGESVAQPEQATAGMLFVSQPVVQSLPEAGPAAIEPASPSEIETVSPNTANATMPSVSELMEAAEPFLGEFLGANPDQSGAELDTSLVLPPPFLFIDESERSGDIIADANEGTESVQEVQTEHVGNQLEGASQFAGEAPLPDVGLTVSEAAGDGGDAKSSDQAMAKIGSREIPVSSQIAARLSVVSEGKIGLRVYTSNNSVLLSVEDLERLSYALVEPKLHEALDKIRQKFGAFVSLDDLRAAGIGVRYDAARNQIFLEMD